MLLRNSAFTWEFRIKRIPSHLEVVLEQEYIGSNLFVSSILCSHVTWTYDDEPHTPILTMAYRCFEVDIRYTKTLW